MCGSEICFIVLEKKLQKLNYLMEVNSTYGNMVLNG